MHLNKQGATCYGPNESIESRCPECKIGMMEETGEDEHEGEEFAQYGVTCKNCGAVGFRCYSRSFDGYIITETSPDKERSLSALRQLLIRFDEEMALYIAAMNSRYSRIFSDILVVKEEDREFLNFHEAFEEDAARYGFYDDVRNILENYEDENEPFLKVLAEQENMLELIYNKWHQLDFSRSNDYIDNVMGELAEKLNGGSV